MNKYKLVAFLILTMNMVASGQVTEKWFVASLGKTPYQLGKIWNIRGFKENEDISFELFGTKSVLHVHYNPAKTTDTITYLLSGLVKDSIAKSLNKFVIAEYKQRETQFPTYYTYWNNLVSVLFLDTLGLVSFTKSDRPDSKYIQKVKYLNSMLEYSLRVMSEEDAGLISKIKDLHNRIYDLRLNEDVINKESKKESEITTNIMKFYSNIDLVERFDDFLRQYEDKVKRFKSEIDLLYNK